ncbi:unnamed protein product [Caenorhabditis sp. 36 PRJEB53466]|nr:unnamed protein product [Caenorhabditis sp. 36 PRJEB53466]
MKRPTATVSKLEIPDFQLLVYILYGNFDKAFQDTPLLHRCSVIDRLLIYLYQHSLLISILQLLIHYTILHDSDFLSNVPDDKYPFLAVLGLFLELYSIRALNPRLFTQTLIFCLLSPLFHLFFAGFYNDLVNGAFETIRLGALTVLGIVLFLLSTFVRCIIVSSEAQLVRNRQRCTKEIDHAIFYV